MVLVRKSGKTKIFAETYLSIDLIKSKYEKKEDLKMIDKIYFINNNINKYSYLFIFIRSKKFFTG